MSAPAAAVPAASMAGRDLWTAPHIDLAAEVAKVPRRRREDFLPETDRPAAETLPQAELPPGWTDPITGLPLAEAMRADIELRATDFRTFTVVVCHPMMAMTTPGGMVNASPNAAYGAEELRVFASVLRDTLRQKDIVGRYDERLFLLFLPRCKVEEVRIVMDRIRGNLLSAQPNQPQWVDITFGAAAGEVGHSVDGPLKVAYADLLHRNAGPAWFLS
ncbi:MAG: diguanylate cyclase [Acidimicrobiales bacterium]